MPIDFEPEAKIDFAPEARIDFEPESATVSQMAAATRHTVGVVGRAIAARDFAAAYQDAPDSSQLNLDQPDESSMTNQTVAPLGARRRAIEPYSKDVFLTPLLNFPRVTAQEVSDALSMLASASPDLTEEESQVVIDHTMKPGNLEKIVAGAQRAAINIPEAAFSPLGIATLGAGLLPQTAGRIVSGAFTVDMARHIPEQIKQLKEAVSSGDSERITEASGNLLATGAMVVGAGRHAITKPKTPLEQVAPLTAEAVAKAAPVYGDTLQVPKGEQPPTAQVRELMEEGVTRPDAEALVAGTKTIEEVVNGAYAKNITPAWNANVSQVQGGHAEAWIAGYNDAVSRLTRIVAKPDTTPLTTAAVEAVKTLATDESRTIELRDASNKPKETGSANRTDANSKSAESLSEMGENTSSPIAWLESIARTYTEQNRNTKAEQAGKDNAERQLLKSNDDGGKKIAAQGDYGEGAEPKTAVVGTRSPQERQQLGQPAGESPDYDAGGTRTPPSQNAPEASSAQVVSALRTLQEMSDQKEAARSARLLRDVLSQSAPDARKRIESELVQIIQSRSAGVPPARASVTPEVTIANAELITAGDTIQWRPNESERRYQGPVDGIVVDVIKNDSGDIGYNVLSPLAGDPGRVVRVWEHRGTTSRIGRAEVGEAQPVQPKPSLKSGDDSTQRQPKSITDIADEIAARGIEPQKSYGEFVVARDLKPEINAKEWLQIYNRSVELHKLKSPAKPEGERTLTTEPPPAPKWTAATRAGVDLGKQTLAGIPDPVATVKAVIALAKEASPYIKRAGEAVARAARSAKEGVGEFVGEQMSIERMTDYRRSVLNWSSKLQQSFGEADSAQKEIRKAVPDALRREGITNWIQADGDAAVLRTRADATADPKLKAGYEAALSLTPEEIAVANDVRTAFSELGARGQTYDVLNSFKENYVTQTWDLGRGPQMSGSRTLKEKFRFSKASTFPTYFDGEQAGYVPKTKDIAKILPMYLHEMNSVIAARQLVQEMARGSGSDGRPLLAARGGGVPVEGDGGKATLIMPKKTAKDTGDYKVLENQPALTGWRWASKDSDGNPIFLKADLALHPEAYLRLKNVLGKSAVREWYQTRTSAAAQIPKLLVKAIDVAQNETKRTMLGFFAPFHQVQEGTHAVGHRINPFFSIPKIDLVRDSGQLDATKHGLMLLPDRTSAEQFMEGFRHSGLVSMIPKVGPAADWYSHYLFQEYIPGLKFKTYQHILERNTKVYEKELASGEVKIEDVKVLSAEQSNAAYGHLNYADLARNPTIQHMARVFLLAPDFFEARARFTAQGAKGLGGAKVGREQILALATLAIAQAATAWIAAETTGGHWDAKHPFEMVHGDRRYSMRSVPEDIAGLIADSRKFVYSRLSPLVGKGIVQGLSGVDYKGDKVTAGDTAKELAQAPIPLPLRGFLGTSNRSLTAFEELAGSVGLRISRYLPEPVMHSIQLRDEVDLWINRSKKLDSDEERANYLNKQLTDLSPEDRKKAVTRIKQRTSPGVRRRVR